MKGICLTKSTAEKMRKALKDGEIKLESLYRMDSESRRIFFKQFVGEDMAPTVNAKFEAAMLSEQKKALENWVKQVTKPTEIKRKDMLSRVHRLEKIMNKNEGGQFVSDLAESKLGVGISEEEAKTVIELGNRVKALRAKIPPEYELLKEAPPLNKVPKEVIDFAAAQWNFAKYADQLTIKHTNPTIMEYLTKRQWDLFIATTGAMKSGAGSWDASFMGRQGINLLHRGEYKIFARAFGRNIKTFIKTAFEKKESGVLRIERSDKEKMAIMTWIYSQPNYINGKFFAANEGFGLGVAREESFPSDLPSRIPFLGRFFHASNTAFSTTALYSRTHLANKYINHFENLGIDMYDKKFANDLSSLILSYTGRGPLPLGMKIHADAVNASLFSARYWTATLDNITGNLLTRDTPEVRKLASKQAMKMYVSLAGLYGAHYLINPDSVPWLSEGGVHATNFGRIKFTDNIEIDPTGGMPGHIKVMAILATGWKYNGKDYTWEDVDKSFNNSRSEEVMKYALGKGSPFAKAVGESLVGEKFGGEPTNVFQAFLDASTPITTELVMEELQKGQPDAMLAIILEPLGLSPYKTTMGGYGPKWLEIKEKLDDPAAFYQATKDYTDRYQTRANQLRNSRQWENMSLEDRNKALEKIKREELNRVYTRYGVK